MTECNLPVEDYEPCVSCVHFFMADEIVPSCDLHRCVERVTYLLSRSQSKNVHDCCDTYVCVRPDSAARAAQGPTEVSSLIKALFDCGLVRTRTRFDDGSQYDLPF